MGKIVSRALIIVDLQNDFMPNGALPIAGADEIVQPINELMRTGKYNLIVATQDWHPPNHCSFKKWPKHCVQGTPGAELHPGLDQRKISAIFRKGMHPKKEEYSVFESKNGPGILSSIILFRIDIIDIVGLAFDYCVRFTAVDAKDYARGHGGWQKVRILKSYTRTAIPKTEKMVLQELKDEDMEVVDCF
jgi:nicotinamidase/pyrazinamidase